MKKILLIILFLQLSSFTKIAFSADYEKGKEAYENEEYSTALIELEPLALWGNFKAQFYMGAMYDQGNGVEKDERKAMKWFRLSAEQGYHKAQHNIGVLYYKGEGVGVDKKQAFKWISLASEDSEAIQSFSALGKFYKEGWGIEQDYKAAFKWYLKAAELGHEFAQIEVGELYEDGKGTLQDYESAIMWYKRSAEQGNQEAQNLLSNMYKYGRGVRQSNIYAHMWANISASEGNETGKGYRAYVQSDMERDEINKAQRLARECVANELKDC